MTASAPHAKLDVMRNLVRVVAFVGVGVAAATACDGGSTGEEGSAGASQVDAGTGGSTPGDSSMGGAPADASLGGAPGDAAPPGCEPPPAPSLAPGTPVTDASVAGTGPCAGTALGTFIAAIHAAHPELADISQIWKQDTVPYYDGTFVYPYVRPDGGFSVAMKRGSGDCPAGCMVNEYWYFDASASCAPLVAGHFKPTSVGAEGCTLVEGEAKWGHPKPIDPKLICNADLTPQDISGTYQLWACGNRFGCDLTAPEGDFTGPATVVVAQSAQDPSTGTVTLSGLGYPAAEGVPLPAKFIRRRFEAFLDQSNLPNACPQILHVSASYDFEGFAWGGVHVDQMTTPDCTQPEKLCGGGLNAKWFEKQ